MDLLAFWERSILKQNPGLEHVLNSKIVSTSGGLEAIERASNLLVQSGNRGLLRLELCELVFDRIEPTSAVFRAAL